MSETSIAKAPKLSMNKNKKKDDGWWGGNKKGWGGGAGGGGGGGWKRNSSHRDDWEGGEKEQWGAAGDGDEGQEMGKKARLELSESIAEGVQRGIQGGQQQMLQALQTIENMQGQGSAGAGGGGSAGAVGGSSSADAWAGVAPPNPAKLVLAKQAQGDVTIPMEKLRLIQDSLQRAEHAIAGSLVASCEQAQKMETQRGIIVSAINVVASFTGQAPQHFGTI